jgi:hypothetical protein
MSQPGGPGAGVPETPFPSLHFVQNWSRVHVPLAASREAASGKVCGRHK